MKSRGWRLVLASVAIGIVAFVSLGMARNGHIQEWNKALGLFSQPNHPEGEESLRRLYNVFSDAIDEDAEVLNSRLKEATKRDDPTLAFTWGQYGHAIFFHWAFNTPPKNHKPLKVQLARCKLDPQQEEKCLRIVNDEWKKRREKCIETVTSCLGVDDEAAATAVAAIIHDIHVLADYVENTRTAPLAPIKELKAEVVEGVKVLAKGYSDNENAAAKVADVGESLNNKVIAAALLSNLAGCVPKCLKDKCGEALARKGIEVGIPST